MQAQVIAVRAEVAGVHEIGRVADHRSIDLYPSLFARIVARLLETATKALNQEFVHSDEFGWRVLLEECSRFSDRRR